MSDVTTFVDECLAGHALATDADDWVDAWHEAPDDSPISQITLAEYLGMSDDEYALWVERPESLRFIIAGRKTDTSPATTEVLDNLVAAAARAHNDAEAVGVIRWLKETGRL